MDDELVLPSDRLVVGDEIARGSFGAVSKARLYGMAVCAKVRLSCARRRACASPTPRVPAPLGLVVVISG
jgi:hypothetical protein